MEIKFHLLNRSAPVKSDPTILKLNCLDVTFSEVVMIGHDSKSSPAQFHMVTWVPKGQRRAVFVPSLTVTGATM